MKVRSSLACVSLFAVAVPVFGQRQWVVYPTKLQDGPWTTVTSGDFPGPPSNPNKVDPNDTSYSWSAGPGIQRAFYDLTAAKCMPVPPNTDAFPVKPAMYKVEQWAPNPAGAPWSEYVPIETTYDGSSDGNDSGEGVRSPFIPWGGQYSANHQWITSNFDGPVTAGTWVASGPGPQAPSTSACVAGGTTGLQMWMKRNSTLYFKFDYQWAIVHPATAIRLTEFVWDNATCGAPASTGPIDLRCAGNADPLYGTGEHYANNWRRSMRGTTIDGSFALAVSDYRVNANGATACVSSPTAPFTGNYGLILPQPPDPQAGLPASGTYVAQGVTFQLHYDGLNTIKWASNDSEFDSLRIVTLNPDPNTPREFVPGYYKNISVLTMSSGNPGNQLNVQAVYSDNTIETHSFNLYHWDNQDGDVNSIAVGVNGNRRADQGDIGFKRFKYVEGWTPNLTASLEIGGGNTGGAFPFLQTAWIDSTKLLKQINLSVSLVTTMEVNVLAISLNSTPCNIPWADTDGDGDVDSADFAVLQRCFTTPPGGTPIGPIALGCTCLDSSGDGQIDVADLNNFLNCAMGPGVTYTHSPTAPYWPNWPGGICPGPTCCPGQPSN